MLRKSEAQRGRGEQLQTLIQRIMTLQQFAHENQLTAAKAQRSYHDAHAKTHSFKKGDSVWLYKASSIERGVTTKLAYRWTGPYTIVKAIGPVTFVLKDKLGKVLPGTYNVRHLYKPL